MPKPHILAFTGGYKHTLEELTDQYDFHYFTNDFTKNPEQIVADTIAELQKNGIKPDAVIGDKDDTSILAAIAAEKLGLIGPSLRSLYLAQHKGVFTPIVRSINKAMPEVYFLHAGTKDFPSLPYPGFVKPVKSGASSFAYMIDSEKDLQEKTNLIWNSSHHVHPWYNSFFATQRQRADNHTSLMSLLYQEFISADQFTVDGFVQNGTTTLLGITKTIYTPDRKSFMRFDFPHYLPEEQSQKLEVLISSLVRSLGFDNSGFNVEFFMTNANGIILIEFNTRLSGQFVPLMKELYTESNVKMIIDVALGKTPTVIKKETKRLASSYPLRTNKDCRAIYVPDKSYYEELAKKLDALSIRPQIEQGKKLSDYLNDAYSFRYAFVDIAGDSMLEIEEKLTAVKRHLGIIFEPV